ncbi:ppt1 [Symbiodinium natans]|uniref:Ppt1 protein n=1 Tax=Symbiodinium natans TaxID=878477 RepID=A0A812JAQ9_9DINO|nr:ppt1 [Symbiodinium natans]
MEFVTGHDPTLKQHVAEVAANRAHSLDVSSFGVPHSPRWEMFAHSANLSVSTRATSATPSLAAAQSRPASASKEASEWTSSPVSSVPELRIGAQAASISIMQQDLQIEEDYGEDNGLEEAIERMRAGRSTSTRAARCTARSKLGSQAQSDGTLSTSQVSPCQPSASRTAKCGEAELPKRQTEVEPVEPYQNKATESKPRSAHSGTRPRSADQKASHAIHRGSTGFESARSRVVGGIRCDQVISRHLPEREVQSKMISVLARQLERLRDCIPAFAAQWQTVETYLEKEERKLVEKEREASSE